MKTCAVFVLVLFLTGCASGSGKKWYAPATWFSSAPAEKVDRALKNESLAEAKVLRDVQEFATETRFALAQAPASKPVAVAVGSNDAALRLLDQVLGPIALGRANDLQVGVDALLSENESLRIIAEADRQARVRQAERDSRELSKARDALGAANAKLRVAFERENELADQLRVQQARVYILIGVAVLLAVGWLYTQIAFGGIAGAAGRFMSALRVRHPNEAENLAELFDQFLNRSEQELIRKKAGL